MKFKVTYASGLVDIYEFTDENQSLEGFVNAHFGSVDPAEYGAKIEVVSDIPTTESTVSTTSAPTETVTSQTVTSTTTGA